MLPISVNLYGNSFIHFELSRENSMSGVREVLAPLKYKKYHKEELSKNDLIHSLLVKQINVILNKNEFRVPVDFSSQKITQSISTYLVWVFDEGTTKNFDKLILTVGLFELEENQSISQN